MSRAFAFLLVLICCGCQSLVIVRGHNRNVQQVNIEIDYTTALPPDPILLSSLKGQLEAICDPGVRVNLVVDDAIQDNRASWSSAALEMFAWLHHDNQDWFYLIWAAGRAEMNPSAGGYSWNKRCMAVFPEVYPNDAGKLQLAAAHEWCHCIGLVGKFLEMQQTHQHAYGHHCDQPQCLMQPASWVMLPCPMCMADLTAGVEKSP